MEAPSVEQKTLDGILELLTKREQTYETGLQTTVCGKVASGWQNWLTKLEFVRKGESAPEVVTYEYSEVVIVRRVLSGAEMAASLKRLVVESLLETCQSSGSVALQGRFSMAGSTRRAHSEWSRWPAEVFIFEPSSSQNFPGNTHLVALDAPYYPSLDHVLSDLFEIRSQGWSNYFRGQVAIVLPDFRARISKLTIALACLRADFECRLVLATDLVVKVYAENSVGRLLQQTLHPNDFSIQVDLADTATFASLVLMSKPTGEVLDERTFQANASWREPGVLVDVPEEEIEQIILTGESEALEFREKLDRGRPERLAKTAAAFANTKGGTIVFGVDDDHHVVGCSIQGMADTITNIIRSYCDPSPEFTTRVVRHEEKDLLLVKVAESIGRVHTVKDLGPFIRANGTNRAPTSYELEAVFRRHSSSNGLGGLL
jgi:Putative DNA-binding domain